MMCIFAGFGAHLFSCRNKFLFENRFNYWNCDAISVKINYKFLHGSSYPLSILEHRCWFVFRGRSASFTFKGNILHVSFCIDDNLVLIHPISLLDLKKNVSIYIY